MKNGSIVACVLASAATLAAAAPRDDAQTDLRCRKEVKEYVDALKFVRQTAGDRMGDRVAKGYVSEEDLTKTVVARGPCAGAQMLREKGVAR